MSNILMLARDSISHFFSRSMRSKNDASNRIREQVLSALPSMAPNHPYLEDPQWKHVHDAFSITLYEFTHGKPIDQIPIEAKGGRGHSYDFLIDNRPVEFKNGVKSVTQLPQILSIPIRFSSDKWLGNDDKFQTYTRTFYESYLDEWISAAKRPLVVPPPYEYAAEVINPTSRCAFFAALKESESPLTQSIVDKSVHDYLHHLSLQNLSDWKWDHIDSMLKSQNAKTFLLWANGSFRTQTIEMALDPIASVKFKAGRKGLLNSMLFPLTNGGHLDCLLRWRNHKGILNPAWQIKFVAAKPSPVHS